jgi:hypothetical protein
MRDDQLTPFEEAMARRLAAYGEIDVRPRDPIETARRVMARPRPVGIAGAWARLHPTLRAAVVLALLGAMLVSAVLVGAQLARVPLTALPSLSAAPDGTPFQLGAWVAEADWITDAHGIPGTADPLRLRLSSSADGSTITLAWGTAENESIPSTVRPGGPGELDLETTQAGTSCAVGAVGRYQVVVGEPVVTLVAISDACAARRTMLAQPWVRAFDGTNEGGAGVLDLFQPGDKVLVQLPRGHYLASVGPDAASLTDADADRTLLVVRNPIGLSEPCSSSGGAKRDVPSTMVDLSAFLGTLPGLTVNTAAMTIDARPAMKLTIPTTPTADCPGGRVAEWTPRNPATNTFWFITQGDTDRLYLTEVERPCAVGEGTGPTCRDLFLIQWLGAGVTDAEEQAITASIRFLEALPTTQP